MTPQRLAEIAAGYGRLRVAVVGDLALDAYLHIDPSREGVSLETGRRAYAVTAVRPQAGAAGNVAANLAALQPAGLGVVGVVGPDGAGWELRRALERLGADLTHLVTATGRLTFAYIKPLMMHPGQPAEELDRIDIRSPEPTPPDVEDALLAGLAAAAGRADVIVAMDQCPDPSAGVFTPRVTAALSKRAAERPGQVWLADSRADVGRFAHVAIKCNETEGRAQFGGAAGTDGPGAGAAEAPIEELALQWSKKRGRAVFVTRGERGIVCAADGRVHSVPARPVAGPVDIVGAGDAVAAHLAMALGAGATPLEAAEIANLAGGVVVRKLGTTGTASVAELVEALR